MDFTIEYQDKVNPLSWFIDHMNQFILEYYQRPIVWNIVQQERLIESFMMGIKVPGIMLHKQKKKRGECRTSRTIWSINDGQQRLTAIYEFTKNNISWKDENGMRVFYNKEFNDFPTDNNARNLSGDEMYTFKESSLQYTEFQSSCEQDALIENFRRINSGKNFSKKDNVGIYLHSNFVNSLLLHIFNINDEELLPHAISLWDLGFFHTFEISTFKKISHSDELFVFQNVPLAESNTRGDMSNRDIICSLIPYVVSALNDDVIPYEKCQKASTEDIHNYMEYDFTPEHIIKVYHNLCTLLDKFPTTIGSNAVKRSLRNWRNIPCIVAWDLYKNYNQQNLNWHVIIAHFESTDDNVEVFKDQILGREKSAPRTIGQCKEFYRRIVDMFPRNNHPGFYI